MNPPVIRIASAGDRERWNAFLQSVPQADFFQRFEWNTIFSRTFHCKTQALIAETQDGVCGVLPLFIIDNLLLLRGYASSMPGGICALDDGAAKALLDGACEIAETMNLDYLKIRENQPAWSLPHTHTQIEHTYTIDPLPDSIEEWWKSIDKKARNQVRKAQKAGFEIQWGNENVADFYQVYARTMRDMGTPAIPAVFFEASAASFPENINILTLSHHRKPVAAAYLIEWKDTLSNPFASSLQAYFSLCPNNLLYWEMVGYAIRRGLRVMDMGRSEPASTHAHFKEQFSASPQPRYNMYAIIAGKQMPESSRTRVYGLASRLWKRLPMPLAARLSPLVRRRIPLG